MGGLVAVIADDREPVDDDARALERTFAAVRGCRAVHHVEPAGWARATRFARADEPAGQLDGFAFAGSLHPGADPATAAPADLRGHFALVRRAPGERARDGSVEVVGDPLGMQALYVAERASRTYVSTSAIALARHLRRPPDPLGVRQFLRAGSLYGPLTLWDGVERLEPGEMLTISADGRRRRDTYWLPGVDHRVRELAFDAAVDHCVETAVESLRRAVGTERCTWADLTGGFDSRLLAVLARAAGVPLRTATNGEDGQRDVELARAVARSAGLPWRRFGDGPAGGIGEGALDDAVGWSDGGLDVLQLAQVLLHQRAKGASCHVLLGGGGGEHFSPYAWVQEYPWAPRARRARVNLLVARFVPRVDLGVLREERAAEVEDHFRALYTRRAALYADEPAAVQCDAIYLYKSMGHFGAYRSANEAYLRQELPFYYRDIFTAAFSTNPRWRNGHRLPRAVIERLDPAIASIPTTRGAPAERLRLTNAHRFAPYYGLLLTKGARKARQRWRPAATRLGAHAPEAQALAGLDARGLFDLPRMRSGGLYRPEVLASLVAGAQRPGFGGWKVLARVATVELALQAADAG